MRKKYPYPLFVVHNTGSRLCMERTQGLGYVLEPEDSRFRHRYTARNRRCTFHSFVDGHSGKFALLLEIPNNYHLVPSTRQQQLPIGGQAQAGDSTVVTLQHQQHEAHERACNKSEINST